MAHSAGRGMRSGKSIGSGVVEPGAADGADVGFRMGAPGAGVLVGRVGEGVGLGAREEFLLVVVAEGLVGPRFRGGVEPAGFQASALGVVFVADVLFAGPSTDGEPFEASADGFDEVPRVESVYEGALAEVAAFVSGFWVHVEAGPGFGGDDGGTVDVVFFPREGKEM